MLMRCWPPLLPPSPPSPNESRNTGPRVALLAGFILFGGFIWPGRSVFQIAEAGAGCVTERRSTGLRNIAEGTPPGFRFRLWEKELGGSWGSLVVGSIPCGSHALGLGVRAPGLGFIALSSWCWNWRAERPGEQPGPSAWRRAAVVHFQCVGPKV